MQNFHGIFIMNYVFHWHKCYTFVATGDNSVIIFANIFVNNWFLQLALASVCVLQLLPLLIMPTHGGMARLS